MTSISTIARQVIHHLDPDSANVVKNLASQALRQLSQDSTLATGVKLSQQNIRDFFTQGSPAAVAHGQAGFAAFQRYAAGNADKAVTLLAKFQGQAAQLLERFEPMLMQALQQGGVSPAMMERLQTLTGLLFNHHLHTLGADLTAAGVNKAAGAAAKQVDNAVDSSAIEALKKKLKSQQAKYAKKKKQVAEVNAKKIAEAKKEAQEIIKILNSRSLDNDDWKKVTNYFGTIDNLDDYLPGAKEVLGKMAKEINVTPEELFNAFKEGRVQRGTGKAKNTKNPTNTNPKDAELTGKKVINAMRKEFEKEFADDLVGLTKEQKEEVFKFRLNAPDYGNRIYTLEQVNSYLKDNNSELLEEALSKMPTSSSLAEKLYKNKGTFELLKQELADASKVAKANKAELPTNTNPKADEVE